VLEAKNITRRYRSSGRGVADVSLSVEEGGILGLVGPNGSGKSTLLRVLSTAIEPDGGTFRIGGADGIAKKQEARAKMGLMLDRPTHYGDLSGWANAYLFARSYGMEEEKAERALGELFEYFDLAEYKDDRAKTYSYGMSKKLALIEAIAHGPQVLLLDEPSLGLDYASQLAYQRKLRQLAAEGAAVLLASNGVDEVEALCDRVVFLRAGKILRSGTPEELVSSLRGVKRVVATLRNPVDYAPLARLAGVERVAPEDRDLVVHCEDRPGIVADVVAGIVAAGGDVADLAVRRPSLADVYLELTGEALGDEA
jgi:ABC-2 type transport system ATP-binding protein